jgi:large subunit ribosomal protein L24
MKLRKGDTVEVLAGKDVGRQGEIVRVIRARDRVVVRGVNRAKKHQKPTRATMQGGIIDKDMPIHVSNVGIVCGSCGVTRVGYRIDDAGVKHRICRKCKGDL